MGRRLTKIKSLSFLSLVPKGANWFPVLYKEANATDPNFECQLLTKAPGVDFEEKGLVTALAYVPDRKDSQGDSASPDVVAQMCHMFAKEGLALDLRHDGKLIGKERAHVVENFIVQKGDARFANFADYDGKPVDATGGWGVVIKVDDQELRKNYRSGQWNGVSLFGRADYELEKAGDSEMTPEQLKAALAENTAALLKAVDEKIALAKIAPAPPPPPEGRIIKLDLTDKKAVEKRLGDLRREKLEKEIDLDDEDALSLHLESLKKAEEESQRNETPDQKVARLEKENLELRARASRLAKSSTLPPSDDAEEKVSFNSEETGLSKDALSNMDRARKRAQAMNKERGLAK